MRRTFLFLIFSSLIAGISGLGEIRADCPFHTRLPDDFIVFPGQPGVSHMHDFFGATDIDAFSNPTIMMNSYSNCDPPVDHSAYWLPTLICNEDFITPERFTIYYHTFENFDDVETIPLGFVIISRKHKWSCYGGGGDFSDGPIPNCHNEKLELYINFPDCWDGVNLDSPDHMSHMAYSAAHVCPDSHPHLLPRTQYKVRYPVTNGHECRLSAGDGNTAHADFVNGWEPEALQLRVDECSRANKKCEANLPGDSSLNLILGNNTADPGPDGEDPGETTTGEGETTGEQTTDGEHTTMEHTTGEQSTTGEQTTGEQTTSEGCFTNGCFCHCEC